MKKILYEASFKFEFAYLVPIIFVVIAVVIAVLMKKGKKVFRNQDSEKYGEIVKSLGTIWVVGVFIMSGAVLLSCIFSYKNVIVSYKNGNYQIVEGYVENFVPMPYTGHSRESFDIDGIKFDYSDYNLTYGYNNTKSHGGVITGDGQHLKVGYVYDDSSYDKIIVYIEELP